MPIPTKQIANHLKNQNSIVGSVERITYRNDETDYVIAKLRLGEAKANLVTIVGILPTIYEGERIQASGEWLNHPKYGLQFQVSEFKSMEPTTIIGIQKYLSSGLIKGIGPVYAEKIVGKFGLSTLTVLDENAKRLKEVKGIGRKRYQIIVDAWQSQRQIREVMLFLASHGVSTTYAIKIYKEYGTQSISVLKKNPYQLAEDIFGVGFLTADKIAKNIGVSETEPARIESGIKYTLNQAKDQGHLFLRQEQLVEACSELLKVEKSLIQDVYHDLTKLGHLIEEKDEVYLPYLYRAEIETAELMIKLLKARFRSFSSNLFEDWLNTNVKRGFEFNKKQKEAILKALREKILIITGGPGTGKTTLIKGIIHLFSNLKQNVKLAAPTGRAAKRLSESTGHKAVTIHRLLEFDANRWQFSKNDNNLLQLDVLIIDEMSMVDILLTHSLVKALPFLARLIVVGDVNQLPSVGPGNVLKDMIRSKTIPVVNLDQIFRQAENSDIIRNAHLINQGLTIELTRKNKPGNSTNSTLNKRIKPIDDYGDFLFVQEEDPGKIAELIIELCTKKLPGRYNYNPINDIQILTPMHKGSLGVENLNKLLQSRVNPNKLSIQKGHQEFRLGDRVMQIRNNYDKNVFNGDIGKITLIDLKDQTVTITFEKQVEYKFSDLDEIVLAYATTVHKSQGSEFRVVIIPIVTQHYLMLQRNLFYTAVTRARELMILIGTKKALGMAIKNNKVQERNTRLSSRLQELLPSNSVDL